MGGEVRPVNNCLMTTVLGTAATISLCCLFRAAAGSLARCLYCDCDSKLFGTAIAEYLIDNGSKIVSAPAKRQSTNGLVESHWKVMVHMARAYLTGSLIKIIF